MTRLYQEDAQCQNRVTRYCGNAVEDDKYVEEVYEKGLISLKTYDTNPVVWKIDSLTTTLDPKLPNSWQGFSPDLSVSVSRPPCDNRWEQISKQAQEEGHILCDELRKVHVPKRLHEQKIFIFVQIVALCLARSPV